MKKYIISLGLALATFSSQGQNFLSQSFIADGITSITATNLLQPTNLLYAASVGTNHYGILVTNLGVQVVITNGVMDYQNLFKDVTLWSDREGRPYCAGATNSVADVGDSTDSPAAVVVKTQVGSGANSAVTFAFAPVYTDAINNGDGSNGNEVTSAADFWIFSVTPTASSTQVWSTNAPMYRWGGAKKLRLLYVSNADTDASSNVKLLGIQFTGFRP